MSDGSDHTRTHSQKVSRTGLRIVALCLFVMSIAIPYQGIGESTSTASDEIDHGLVLCWSISILCGITAIGFLSASFGSRSWLRLDVFLPFLRKKKQKEVLEPDGLSLVVVKSILPDSLFADRITGKPGLARRILKRIGPVTYSSPFRRLVQAVCFLTFLYLFFVVCWPYGAQPSAATAVSESLQFSELRQEDGALRFRRGQGPSFDSSDSGVVPGQELELVLEPERGFGRFSILESSDEVLTVLPVGELSEKLLDQLFTSNGPWALYNRAPDAWPDHYTAHLQEREALAAESFLVIDPLVSISTAIASRSWVWSITCAAAILIVCIVIPRGFCGFICPLGTLIDFFDWSIGKRIQRTKLKDQPHSGWWVHVKYYLLTAILICGTLGILISGYFAAIPVITRGLMFIGEPLQSGLARDWHLVAPIGLGHWISIALFIGVLSLGLLRPRFWCKYVCPSGAVFSIGNLFRVSERKVESSCIHCDKCIEICPFDAIKPDYTTRVTDCTLCQSCAGVCPTKSIKFVDRWNLVELKVENDPPTHETQLGRRGFMSLAVGSTAATAGGVGAAMATGWSQATKADDDFIAVRPPGSVPEDKFLQMCIRCGECFKVCPNNVLQSEGFEQGLAGLWTPMVDANWAGCDSSCNACGQVCPTGAIRPLPLEEKRVARMGLAVVNESTCLPFADTGDCDLCVQECNAAGYDAIEYINVGTQVDKDGTPIEGSGRLAPVVIEDKCVGCGLCQTRCYAINVKEEQLIADSAIVIEAGEGKEDRLMTGSYLELHSLSQKN